LVSVRTEYSAAGPCSVGGCQYYSIQIVAVVASVCYCWFSTYYEHIHIHSSLL